MTRRKQLESQCSSFSHLGHAIERVNFIFMGLAVVTMLGMIFLTVSDVSCRFILGRIIIGAFEVNEMLVAACIFLGIAYVQRVKGHIRVELITAHFSKRAQIVVEILMLVVSLGLFILFLWSALESTVWSYQISEVRFGTVRIITWPAKMLLAIGAFLIVLQLVVDLVRKVAEFSKTKAKGSL